MSVDGYVPGEYDISIVLGDTSPFVNYDQYRVKGSTTNAIQWPCAKSVDHAKSARSWSPFHPRSPACRQESAKMSLNIYIPNAEVL
jgi:hypothetical protein